MRINQVCQISESPMIWRRGRRRPECAGAPPAAGFSPPRGRPPAPWRPRVPSYRAAVAVDQPLARLTELHVGGVQVQRLADGEGGGRTRRVGRRPGRASGQPVGGRLRRQVIPRSPGQGGVGPVSPVASGSRRRIHQPAGCRAGERPDLSGLRAPARTASSSSDDAVAEPVDHAVDPGRRLAAPATVRGSTGEADRSRTIVAAHRSPRPTWVASVPRVHPGQVGASVPGSDER